MNCCFSKLHHATHWLNGFHNVVVHNTNTYNCPYVNVEDKNIGKKSNSSHWVIQWVTFLVWQTKSKKKNLFPFALWWCQIDEVQMWYKQKLFLVILVCIHLFVRWNFKISASPSVILLISQVINWFNYNNSWFNSFIWHHHSFEKNFLEKQKAQQRSLDNKNWLILRVKLNWHSFWCLGLEWMFS